MDNTTPHAASDYEREITRTIPFHSEILAQAIEATLVAHPSPGRWLDTGCGPGKLVELARARCRAEFTLADPSREMLDLARAKHGDMPPDRFLHVASQELPDAAPFDAITAVQCHHYSDRAGRECAVSRCFELLGPRGVFVAFENVRAETDAGQVMARERWGNWLRGQGHDEKEVRTFLARENTKYFPIRVSEHLELLSRVGFSVVELLWRSFAQAGFVCLRK